MIDLLEKDKDHLLTELAQAAVPEKATRVLENQMDKLLLCYNDQCDNEKERDAAAYMMQAVRLSMPMVDSIGETKVWERETSSGGAKKTIPALILIIIAVALAAVALIPNITISEATGLQTTETTRYAFGAAGILVAAIAGFIFGKPVNAGDKEQQVEVRVDSAKTYRNLRTAILAVDQSLEEIQAAERWAKREKAGEIDGKPATSAEIDLFSDLLAAAYSKDPEYALEKIEDVKYFLHRQQIDAVDYSEATKQYFDLMPGKQGGTIRPALVSDGKLLKKGLAASGK
ncbi:MAG: hypothetical protein J6H21_01855 [Firmicutes bacterium]|nr:hypothetical protein [Bacillota bacterium]